MTVKNIKDYYEKIISVCVPAALAAAFFLVSCQAQIEQTMTEVTIEAGDPFTFDVEEYFSFANADITDFEISGSDIDTSVPGEYEIVVAYQNKTWTVTVHVKDTTVPQILADTLVIFTATLLNPEDLADYEDNTKCTCRLLYIKYISETACMEEDELLNLLNEEWNENDSYDEISPARDGVYLAVLQVTDEGENSAYQPFLIVYDTSVPEISGDIDDTVEQGEEPDTGSLKAYDDMDGEISTIEKDLIQSEEVWTVTVTCSDRAGNTATKVFTVSIDEDEESQEEESTAQSSSYTASEQSSTAADEETDDSSSSLVADLDAAESASSLIIIAAGSGSKAQLSMYIKTSGEWEEIVSTSVYIGRNGIGKTTEGDGKTLTGLYHIIKAFGVSSDPGTSLSYLKVDDSYYWVDDSDSVYYNQLVSTQDVTQDWDSAEHISASPTAYAYVLALDYNEECTPGKGSAIFIHCSIGKATSGCIAVPSESMKEIMRNITSDCAVIIDYESNIENY